MPHPDPTPQPASNDVQPLPPGARGIPGVSSEPIEVSDDMKEGLADAAPSEGTGVTGSVEHRERQKQATGKQPGGPA